MQSRFTAPVYIALGAIFVASFAAGFAAPRAAQAWLAAPAPLALLGALFQLVRDQAAHERASEMQREQHAFTLGAVSHMAVVAFDKHMAFCEEYVRKMDQGLRRLIVDGPRKEVIQLAQSLHEIRSKYHPWIASSTEAAVVRYERALDQIGIDAMGLDHAEGEARKKLVDRMLANFSSIVGFQYEGAGDPAIAASAILEHLQQSLGVNELAELREGILRGALDAVRRRAKIQSDSGA